MIGKRIEEESDILNIVVNFIVLHIKEYIRYLLLNILMEKFSFS